MTFGDDASAAATGCDDASAASTGGDDDSAASTGGDDDSAAVTGVDDASAAVTGGDDASAASTCGDDASAAPATLPAPDTVTDKSTGGGALAATVGPVVRVSGEAPLTTARAKAVTSS